MTGRFVGRRARTRMLGAVGAVMLLAGCGGDDPLSPEEEIAGTYAAVQWTIVSPVETWDVIEGGGHLDLVLHADGTTEGEYFIPDGASPGGGRPSPEGYRVSLEGTWTRTGDVVRFDMPGDTYLRFVDWEVSGRELRNELTNGGYVMTTHLRR